MRIKIYKEENSEDVYLSTAFVTGKFKIAESSEGKKLLYKLGSTFTVKYYLSIGVVMIFVGIFDNKEL